MGTKDQSITTGEMIDWLDRVLAQIKGRVGTMDLGDMIRCDVTIIEAIKDHLQDLSNSVEKHKALNVMMLDGLGLPANCSLGLLQARLKELNEE